MYPGGWTHRSPRQGILWRARYWHHRFEVSHPGQRVAQVQPALQPKKSPFAKEVASSFKFGNFSLSLSVDSNPSLISKFTRQKLQWWSMINNVYYFPNLFHTSLLDPTHGVGTRLRMISATGIATEWPATAVTSGEAVLRWILECPILKTMLIETHFSFFQGFHLHNIILKHPCVNNMQFVSGNVVAAHKDLTWSFGIAHLNSHIICLGTRSQKTMRTIYWIFENARRE